MACDEAGHGGRRLATGASDAVVTWGGSRDTSPPASTGHLEWPAPTTSAIATLARGTKPLDLDPLAAGDEGDLPSTSGSRRPRVATGTTATIRADVVGSLLRPEYLREARDAARTGTIDADELRAVEDRAVLEAIALQESAGIEAITDGEYRRTGWIAFIPMVDDPLFIAPVSGFEFLVAESGWRDLWKTGAGEPADTSGLPPEEPFVTRRLQVERDIVGDEFSFLRTNAKARTKYTIPAPSWHRIYWHADHSRDAYPTSDDFIAHIARLTREHIVDRLVELGCDYIQLDAPNYAQWHIDPDNRAAFEEHGHDMAHELVADAEFDNTRLRWADGRHARDAHVSRQRPRRHVGRDRRLRGDLEGGLPAPDQLSTGCCSSTTRSRGRLRAARGRPAPPPGRARARDDEGRDARGSGRRRRAGRGGERGTCRSTASRSARSAASRRARSRAR